MNDDDIVSITLPGLGSFTLRGEIVDCPTPLACATARKCGGCYKKTPPKWLTKCKVIPFRQKVAK